MYAVEQNNIVQIRRPDDVVRARRQAGELAAQLGFCKADQTRLATAVAELTRNVVAYAGLGRCEIRDDSDLQCNSVRVVVEDHGPGIADLELAMRDGHGGGLPGTRRLVDSFSIESGPGLTRVTISLTGRR
jgi:serine/threonine-protein kinase RsbT